MTDFQASPPWRSTLMTALVFSFALLITVGVQASDSKITPLVTADDLESSELTGGPIGPDVIVGVLPGTSSFGQVGNIVSYSVGTTSCNKGDAELRWEANNNNHPVIGQNLYRLKNDRLEQIGMSWLKHGFLALAGDACGLGCIPPGTGTRLGVGCSDPYSSGLNGSQSGLGPRFEVNATTGIFSYPFTDQGQTGNAVYKRLQVHVDDVTPAMNAGALYFIEGHYIASDDAAAGNGLNNASYREVTVSAGLNLNTVGSTQRERPAILAWPDTDPTVEIDTMDVPSDGRFTLATKVVDNLDGTWRYEYAVHNLNSHRSGRLFSVPVDPSVTVTDIGFRDVDHHSGEPWDTTDWPGTFSGGTVSWMTDTFTANANANALRWGTMYNFWFTANEPPAMTKVRLHLFRDGTPTFMTADTMGPGGADPDIFTDGFESGNTSAWTVTVP
ncbi:MAG: hypothetical protein K0U98_11830 [Deltaproteobacteria bacterium]|nr:hypothetical protein [Deltaproteobacteria bacterium]